MARKPTEIVPLMLRLRESLRRRLEQAAKRSEQSMNAEIVDRLEKSFGRDDMETMIAEALGRLEQRREELDQKILTLRIELMHRQLLELVSMSNDPVALRTAALEAIAELDQAKKDRQSAHDKRKSTKNKEEG